MESSLSPREIQTRIRAGASVAEVAHEAARVEPALDDAVSLGIDQAGVG